MYADNYSGATRQPQAPVTVHPQVDTQPQPLTFSEEMNVDQLSQWLIEHPKLVGKDYQEDSIKKTSCVCFHNSLEFCRHRCPIGLWQAKCCGIETANAIPVTKIYLVCNILAPDKYIQILGRNPNSTV